MLLNVHFICRKFGPNYHAYDFSYENTQTNPDKFIWKNGKKSSFIRSEKNKNINDYIFKRVKEGKVVDEREMRKSKRFIAEDRRSRASRFAADYQRNKLFDSIGENSEDYKLKRLVIGKSLLGEKAVRSATEVEGEETNGNKSDDAAQREVFNEFLTEVRTHTFRSKFSHVSYISGPCPN